MEDSVPDVFGFNLKPGNSSKAINTEAATENNNMPLQVQPRMKFNAEDHYYDMSGKKRLVIFNHYSYKASRYYDFSAPKTRKGTDKDVERLNSVFGELLGFVTDTYNDLDYADIWDIFKEMSKEDFSSLSCLCVAILTHGTNDGVLFAKDRGYFLDDVIKLFETNPTLVNRPKLFFIQACRGRKMDAGMPVYTDGESNGNAFVVPTHADFLIMRATVEDYVSFRDDRGSWLIQELCAAIEDHYKDCSLLEIITRVNRKLAYTYQSYTIDYKSNAKKQIPETCFTLTKILKFE